MKRLLLPLLAALALPTSVNAEVDPKVHKMCLAANDYLGCVKAQSGTSLQPRMTIDQGVSLVEGNACPNGFAYVGGGTCQRVECYGSGLFMTIGGSNDPRLKDKGWKKQCTRAYPLLRFATATTRAYNDPKCPIHEPEIGWRNTCDQAAGPITKKEKKESPAGINCDSAVWRNKPQCNDYRYKYTKYSINYE